MSHFSVLVITPEEPTDDVLRRVLQPFHQFECTGTNDEYVQEIDETEERRKEYMEDTRSMVRLPSGELVSSYDERFYRDPTPEETAEIGPIPGSGGNGRIRWSSSDWGDGKGYRAKVHFIPDRCEEIEVQTHTLETFAEYLESDGKHIVPFGSSPDTDGDHKYGYALLDASGEVVKVVDRTNPNKRWDYWRVGGRYAGKLIPLHGQAAEKADLSWEWKYEPETEHPTGYDICRRDRLDFDGMKRASIEKRRKWAEECCQKATLTWGELDRACQEQIAATKQWRELPEPRPRGAEYKAWCRENGFPNYAAASVCFELPEPAEGQSLAAWCEAAPALSSFAVLKDGKWYERGEMGWWACVSNEKPAEEWETEFEKLVESTPGDHWFTIVDCHI